MEQRPDRFPAIVDANVLFSALKRNILLYLEEAGFFRPRWSLRIIGEIAAAMARDMKDFPADILSRYAIEPMAADAFIADLIDLNQADADEAIEGMRVSFSNPAYTRTMLLDRMTEIGLIESAAILRALRR